MAKGPVLFCLARNTAYYVNLRHQEPKLIMTCKTLIFEQPVTLIGGGAACEDDLRMALNCAPRLVAADGGADQALAFGCVPEVVIGDLDSLSAAARARFSRGMEQNQPAAISSLLHIPEQDTTDFDKALRTISAPFALAVGFLGARLDHQLAALHVLVQDHPTPCILLGEHEIVIHLDRPIALSLEVNQPVSLFPLAQVQGRSTGFEWPIDGLDLSPMQSIGTSNRACASDITLEADGPGLLALLPRSCLSQVIAQYLGVQSPRL